MTLTRFGQSETRVCAVLVLIAIGIGYGILGWKSIQAGEQTVKIAVQADVDPALTISPHGPHELPR
jgi:uncharacterized protein HemX